MKLILLIILVISPNFLNAFKLKKNQQDLYQMADNFRFSKEAGNSGPSVSTPNPSTPNPSTPNPSTPNPNTPNPNPENNANLKNENDEDDNSGFKAFEEKIYLYAKELSKKREDPETKRPIFIQKNKEKWQKKMAEEMRKTGYNLKYITEPYRFCIFPYGEVNSISYCENTFMKISKTRSQDCKNMMCMNCCNHLLLIMKYVTSQSIVSEILGLGDDSGFNKMKGFVTQDVIANCRSTCEEEYKVDHPLILPPPPKDPTLGTEANPAKSCSDIRFNGVKAKDGVYHVKIGKKPAIKVYCDMTTDGGGWTLFYSYVHHPFEDVALNAQEIPTSPTKSRSHMHLEQLGFDNFDVTELRFFCTSNHETKPKFIHFKTHNEKVIKVAMNGDQSSLNYNSWTHGYTDLALPKDTKYLQSVRAGIPKQSTAAGKNSNGGFWDAPFHNDEMYWTIRGTGGAKYECGDKLDTISNEGAKYETLHQVWFRGQPPSKEFIQARQLEKNIENKPTAPESTTTL